MSVILRHKMFPLMITFKDPEKNWDEIVKNLVIEEIKKDGFDNFTVIEWEKAKLFLGFKPTVKKAKKKPKPTKKTKTTKKNKKEQS